MRLISATVQDYRIHHSQTVEFDPNRTVIGGRTNAARARWPKRSIARSFSEPRSPAKHSTEWCRGMVATRSWKCALRSQDGITI